MALKKNCFWISIAAGIGWLLLATLLLPNWNWSLFDEIGWLGYHQRHEGIGYTINWLYKSYGRLFPATVAINLLRFDILGTDPRVIRLERIFEFIGFIGLIIFYLKKQFNLSSLWLSFAVASLLKSPPLLETLRVLTLSELLGMTAVLLALICYSRSRLLSYFFMACATLMKEPLGLFIALAPALAKRYREALASLVLTGSYFLFLHTQRRGAYYSFGASPATLKEIGLKFFIDNGWLFLIMAVALIKNDGLKKMGALLPIWLSFFGSALVYSFLLAGKASGYSYHFAPAVLFFNIGVVLFLTNLKNKPDRFLTALVLMGVLIFPLRVIWNWHRLYNEFHQPHTQLIAALKTNPINSGSYTSNCEIDISGIGFLAGFKDENSQCANPKTTLTQCCQTNRWVGLLQECPGYNERAAELEQLSRYQAVQRDSANRWALIDCAKVQH